MKAKKGAPAAALYRITSESGVDLGTYGPDCPALKGVKNGMAVFTSLEVGMKTEVHHKMDSPVGRDTRLERFFVERVR